jgi:hypothetical protein
MMDPNFFGGMTPEQKTAFLESMIQTGGASEEDRLLQEQMAMAEALGTDHRHKYQTMGGAALGGMADVIGAVRKRKAQNEAMDQRKDLLGKMGKGRWDAINAYLGMGPGQRPNPYAVGDDAGGGIGGLLGKKLF